MKPGKLPPELLARLLQCYAPSSPEVLLGAGVGLDAAAARLEGNLVVAAADPITFTTDHPGRYLVVVNANDLAVVGAEPKYLLAILLLPESFTAQNIEELFREISVNCAELGVTLLGGHTEITYGLDRPLLCGFMLGEPGPAGLLRPDAARPGDALLLTRGVPVEGSAVLAAEVAPRLREAGATEAQLQAGLEVLEKPGLAVWPEVKVLLQTCEVHALHDVTEGGLLQATWELAQAAKTGVELFADEVPLFEPGATFCSLLGLDPLGTLSSGSLLAALAPSEASKAVAALEQAGCPAAIVGRMLEAEAGCWVEREGKRLPLEPLAADEVLKVLG